MLHESAIRSTIFAVSVVLFGLVVGCAGRKVATSVSDQTFVPGPSRKAEMPAVEIRPVPPPVEEARVTEPPIAPAPALPPRAPSVRAPQPISIEDAYFDFDQFSIRADARVVLEVNARALKMDGSRPLLIEGHCDERGTLAYNLVLGERRAQAAKRYLEDLGVPASQLQIVSYGKERPFCTEHNEACWQSNRRAHFAPR